MELRLRFVVRFCLNRDLVSNLRKEYQTVCGLRSWVGAVELIKGTDTWTNSALMPLTQDYDVDRALHQLRHRGTLKLQSLYHFYDGMTRRCVLIEYDWLLLLSSWGEYGS